MSSKKDYDLSVDLDTIPKEQISKFVFIDIREKMELMVSPVKGIESLHLPFSQFGNWKFEFDPNKAYLVYCAHGMRSLACVEKLRDKAIANVQSINNGAEAVNQYFAVIPKVKS